MKGDATSTPSPQAVLGRRKNNNYAEILIHWKGLSPADATWERLEVIQELFS